MKTLSKQIMIFCIISVVAWLGVRIYHGTVFGIHCTGRLKRAADANDVSLARSELEAALTYLEQNKLTTGYTSIVYLSPDEDLSFYYKNLKQAAADLEKINPKTIDDNTKSNVLSRLRKTILDQTSEGEQVTVPSGIEIYPANSLFFIWGLGSLLLGLVGAAGFALRVVKEK